MSSFRCQSNRPQSRPRERANMKSRCQSRNYVPGLLRLDSTGEVTSANNQAPKIEQKLLSPKDAGNSKSNGYKNLVDNLKMGALINSASAYIGSARNYIESFCPYQTSKGLSRNKGDNSSNGYLQNMNDTLYNFDCHSVPSAGQHSGIANCSCAQLIMNQEADNQLQLRSNIFGAFHCSLLSNCSSVPCKMKGVEKYVPPQRRCVVREETNITPVVDPKLTPYNARLLKNSKRSLSNANFKKDSDDRKRFDSHPPKMCEKKDHIEEPVKELNMDLGEKIDQCKQFDENPCQTEPGSVIPNPIENSLSSTDETISSDVKTDWFEYECDSAKCIPIPVEKIQNATQKCAVDDCSQGLDSKVQQLHSWFSVENCSEDVSATDFVATKCDSSQRESDNTDDKLFYKESLYMKERNTNNCEKTDKVVKNDDKAIQNLEYNCSEESLSKPDSNDHAKTKKEHHVNNDNLISVLYVRSLRKKGKSSAKKRRRQKAQQNENNGQTLTKNDKPCQDKTSKGANVPSSAVAFILGYDSNNFDNSLHSFHVSCDVDGGDSDWTESDNESDENFSSLEDENMLENELGFQCNDLLQNMQFTLCKMQPTESVQSSNSSAIDDINTSWRVQVSVKSEPCKSKSSKKV